MAAFLQSKRKEKKKIYVLGLFSFYNFSKVWLVKQKIAI